MPSARPAAAPLDTHLGFWLRYVSNHVSLRFAQSLEAHDATVTDWVALRTLFDRPGTRHAELVRALGMTKGAASKVVSRLEAKRLVKREAADGSAREQRLVLTAAGRALVPRLAALADANDAHFFGHLGAVERRALLKAMRELVAHHRLQQLPTA